MDNRQAAGYMLLACNRAGLTREQAKEIYMEMLYLLDIKSEEEAEEQGHKWYFNRESN